MSRTHQQGGEPSQRMLRVAELIRHTLSALLSRGAINDPVLERHVITVANVKMSPDLKLATAFIMPLGGRDTEEVMAALDAHRKYLRGEVSHRINLKFAPDIRFKIDPSFEYSAQIDAILNSPKVRQDLAESPEASDEPT
jgi:ribosome-binding factor A